MLKFSEAPDADCGIRASYCPTEENGMGVSNPVETVLAILALIDETRAKMNGTKLASFPWRPSSPKSADDLAELAQEALGRCGDVTEAVIVVTVAAMAVMQQEGK
jgi:hypothetical protein